MRYERRDMEHESGVPDLKPQASRSGSQVSSVGKRSRFHGILLRSSILYIAPLLLSFGLCSILLLAVNANPLAIYANLLFGTFRSRYWISELILKITPLLMCSLAVTLALKVRFWNIGVEGQFCIGAWAAGGIALALVGFPDIYSFL